jgi:hypothetical protein
MLQRNTGELDGSGLWDNAGFVMAVRRCCIATWPRPRGGRADRLRQNPLNPPKPGKTGFRADAYMLVRPGNPGQAVLHNMRLVMTIMQYSRPFLLAALLGTAFAVLPTKADHGELFGISAALAAHTGGGNGRNGGAGHESTSSGNAGMSGGGGASRPDAAHGVDPDRAWDQRNCDLVACD